ncbi:MAG: hypothetical protein VX469_01735, partial [Pseudomonadota bacterium]|nr:hypothetical protein [Pseudomonadota bacterium]
MKSLLQPYIEKQILLEDEESEKNSAKAKGNMYVLVWDVLNSQGITSGFAHKLSDYISKIIAGKKPNPPSSKNLKSSEVKNLVSYGETIAQKWHGWDWKKNPPTPVSASWEDTWGGGRTSYNWGGMPSEKATPANMVDVYGSDSEKHISKLDGYDEVVNKDEPASTIEPEEPKQNEPESREEHSSAEQQAVLKAKREIRNEFDDYKWKNWGGSAVAQQMSSWSGSAEKRPALEKEIRDMLALFGPTKTLITGDDATKIKSGKISDFKKVFMQIGEKPVPEIEKDPGWTTWMWNEIKHFADNEKYAVRLMDRDILEDFLEDKSKSLYINTANGEDDFFWENEPSAAGGQIDKSTVNRDTILSKETDPMKYVPGILAWAEKPDQRQKLHTWMKKQVDNPNHNAKFKLGGEQIPANIFYDRNYVNAHWQDWAKNYDPGLGKVEPYKPVPAQNRDFDDWKREEDAGVAAWKDKYGKTHNWKDGSVKVKMPIWDKVESKWKPNNSGASPLEQPDMKDFMQRGGKDPGAMQQDADDDSDKSVAILMLSLLGFAAGPIGAGVASSIASVSTKLTAQGIASAGLGWLGIHFKSLSDEQRREMALRSSMFVSNLRTSFQYQNDDYYDKFLNDIGDTGSLFSRMVEKNPKLTADQLVNFRRTLDVSGTLMYTGGSPDQGANENINIKNINVENNTSFMRSALDLLNEEEPIVPIDLTRGVEIMSDISASDEQIRDANSVLDAMGMTNWTFVQPKDNTKTQASGNKGTATGAGAYIDVDDDGKISVVQTQRPGREPGKEDKGSEEVARAEVSSHVAGLQVMREIDRLSQKHGYTPPVTQIVAAVEEKIGEVDPSIINRMENPPDEMCEWWWKPGTDEKEIKGTGGPSPGSGWACKAYKRDDDAIDNLNQAVTRGVEEDEKVKKWAENKEENSIAKVEKGPD